MSLLPTNWHFSSRQTTHKYFFIFSFFFISVSGKNLVLVIYLLQEQILEILFLFTYINGHKIFPGIKAFLSEIIRASWL